MSDSDRILKVSDLGWRYTPMGIEDVLAALSAFPIEALVQLGEAIASEISARNEGQALAAGVKAADAAADTLEAEALK